MLEILFSWLSPLRYICIAIDSIAFSLIDNAYDLIVTFSSGTLFNTETLSSVMNNMYFIVGLISLFKIAMLLVNSVINPDKLTEKGNGISNVLVNFVVMLVLLVAVPIVFREAMVVQEKIVKGHYIESLFINTDAMSGKNPGKAMRSIVIGSLITVDDEARDSAQCGSNCEEAIESYDKMAETQSFSIPKLSKGIAVSIKNDDGDVVYVYNYMMLVTFAAGVFVTYVLLSFGLDIAIRMVELSVLVIISPLFIATYIDPKSSKSGPFSKWLKAIAKTYASLFIKLAVLAIMLLFISILTNAKMGIELNGFETLVLLFAILIFAKKAPKMIGDMLGVEGGGLGGLGIGKKIKDGMVGGALAAQAGRAVAGVAGGMAKNAHAAKKAYKNKLRDGNKTAFGRARAAKNSNGFKAGVGSFFNPKENLKNVGRGLGAGVKGAISGIRSGAQAGWDSKDLKDINAKTKVNASAKLNELSPGYNSLGSRIGKTLNGTKVMQNISGFAQKSEDKLFGTQGEREEARISKEKMDKAMDLYGGNVKTGLDGKRNTLTNPVNPKEFNEACAKAGTQNDSPMGLYSALAINNVKGAKVDDKGIVSIDGVSTGKDAKKYCSDNHLTTPYTEKVIESTARETAITKTTEMQQAQTGAVQARQQAAQANAQVMQFEANVKATIDPGTFKEFDKFSKNLKEQTEASQKLSKATTELREAQENDKTPEEINTLSEALKNAQNDYDTATTVVTEQAKKVPAELAESYKAVIAPVQQANKNASDYQTVADKIKYEIEEQVAKKNESYIVTKLDGTNETVNIIENPAQAELVMNLMNHYKTKASDDADKLKPKHDDKK